MISGAPRGARVVVDQPMWTVIHLDHQDTFASIRSKISQAGSYNIALVLPQGFRLFTNPIYLNLLLRLTDKSKLCIVLVSSNDSDVSLPVQAGLAAYRSLNDLFLKEPLGHETSQVAPPPAPRSGTALEGLHWRSTVWAGVVLALLLPLFSAYIFLPRAAVAFRLQSREASGTYTVSAETTAIGVDQAGGIIPASVIESELEVIAGGQVSGTKQVPLEKAKGSVTFVNTRNQTVGLSAGTVVSTVDGKQFATTTSAVLRENTGSRAMVPVIALEAGSAGNVPARSIVRITDPLLSQLLQVQNDAPTAGGSDKTLHFAQDEDIAKLKDQALAKAKEQGVTKLISAKSPDYYLYSEGVMAGILGQRLEHQDEGSPRVELKAKVLVKALAFRESDLHNLLSQRVAKEQGSRYMLVPGSLRVQPLEITRSSNSRITFVAQANALMTPAVDEKAIKEQIRGKTKQEVESYLVESLPLAGRPQVTMGPFWVDKVPRLLGKVSVVVLHTG